MERWSNDPLDDLESRNLTTRETLADAMADYFRGLLYQYIQSEDSLDALMDTFFRGNVDSPEMYSARILAAIAKRASELGDERDFEEERRLNELSRACARVISRFESEELATTAKAFEWMMPLCADVVFEAIALEVQQRAVDFDAADLVILAQAFTFGRFPSPSLFQAISVAIFPKKLDDLDGNQLVQLAISFATANFGAPHLFNAIAERALTRIKEIDYAMLSRTLWAYAKTDSIAPKLFMAVGSKFLERVDYFHDIELARATWAFAKAGTRAPRTFFTRCLNALLRGGLDLPGEYKAKVAWAFRYTRPADLHRELAVLNMLDDTKDIVDVAKVLVEAKLHHGQFFMEAAIACYTKVHEFDATHLVDAAWAFSLAALRDDQERPPGKDRSIFYLKLFREIAAEAVKRIGDLKTHDLSRLAVSYSRLNSFAASELFCAVSVAASGRIAEFDVNDIAQLAWGFSKAEVASPALFATIAKEVLARKSILSYSESILVELAFSFAKSAVAAPTLFATIAWSALPRLQFFTPKSLSRTAWALAMAGLPYSQFSDAVIFFSLNNIGNFALNELAMISWALACLVPPFTPHPPPIHLVLHTTARAPIDALSKLAQSQLYLFLLFARIEQPGLISTIVLEQEFEETLRRAYVQLSSPGTRRVKLKEVVSDVLNEIGWYHQKNFVTEEGLTVDMAQPDSRRAVRVLYPNDFSQDPSTGKFYENGSTLLHSRLLRGLGWSVTHVRFFDLAGFSSEVIRDSVRSSIARI